MCLTIHHLLCCCYCAAWPPDTIITNPTCSDEHANAGPKHAAHNARLPPTITHALPPALSPLPSSFPIIIRSTAERSHPQSAPATTLACILLNDESTPSMRNHTRTQITISYAPRHPPLLLQTDAQYKALIPTAASSSNATPAQLPLIPTPHLTTRSVCQPPHALAAFTTICTPENVQNPQGASKGSANAQNHTLHIVLAPDSSLPFYPMSGRCVMPPTEIPTRVGTPNASKTENAQRPPNEAESTLSVLANLPASQIVLPPTIASVFTPTCAPAPTKNTQSTPDAPTNVQNALLHVLPLPDFLVPFYRNFLRCVMPPTEIPPHGTLYAPKTENAQRPPNEAESTLSVLTDLPASQIVLPPSIASVLTPTCAAAPTENTRSTPADSTNVQNALLHVFPLPYFVVPFYPIFLRCVMPPTEWLTHGTPYASKTKNTQRPPNEAESSLDILADLPASQITIPPPVASVPPQTCAATPTKNTRSTPADPTNGPNDALHKHAQPACAKPACKTFLRCTMPLIDIFQHQKMFKTTRSLPTIAESTEGLTDHGIMHPDFVVPFYPIFLRCVMPTTEWLTHGTPYAVKTKNAQRPPNEVESTPDMLADLPTSQIVIPPLIAPYITPTWTGGAGQDHRSDPHTGPTADLLAKLAASLIDVAGDGHCQYAAALASIAPADWHPPLLRGSKIQEVADAITALRRKAEMALRRLFLNASTSPRVETHLRNKWGAADLTFSPDNLPSGLLDRLSPPALAHYKGGAPVPYKHWGSDDTLHLIAQELQTPIFCFPLDGATHSGGMSYSPLAFLPEDSPLLFSPTNPLRRRRPLPRTSADHLDLYEAVKLDSLAIALELLARAQASGLRPIILAYTGIHYQAIIPNNPEQRALPPQRYTFPPLRTQPPPQQPTNLKPPPTQTHKKPPPAPSTRPGHPSPLPAKCDLPPQQSTTHPMNLRDRSLERAWKQIPGSLSPAAEAAGLQTKQKFAPERTHRATSEEERRAAAITQQEAKQLRTKDCSRRTIAAIRSWEDDDDIAAASEKEQQTNSTPPAITTQPPPPPEQQESHEASLPPRPPPRSAPPSPPEASPRPMITPPDKPDLFGPLSKCKNKALTSTKEATSLRQCIGTYAAALRLPLLDESNLLSIPELVSWTQATVTPEQCLRAGAQGMAHYLSATTCSATTPLLTLAAEIIKRLRYKRSLINYGRTVVDAWQAWALAAHLAQRKATRATSKRAAKPAPPAQLPEKRSIQRTILEGLELTANQRPTKRAKREQKLATALHPLGAITLGSHNACHLSASTIGALEMFTALGVNILCVQETRLGKGSHPSPELRPLLAPFTVFREAAIKIEGRPISAAKQIKKQTEEEKTHTGTTPPTPRKVPRKSSKKNGNRWTSSRAPTPPPTITHTQHLSGGLLTALSHQLGNLATQIAPPPPLEGLVQEISLETIPPVTLFNIYAPPDKRHTTVLTHTEHSIIAARAAGRRCIIMGDFNAGLYTSDRRNPNGTASSGAAMTRDTDYRAWVARLGLISADPQGEGRPHTFTSLVATAPRSARLDDILLDPGLAHPGTLTIHPISRSDHCPISSLLEPFAPWQSPTAALPPPPPPQTLADRAGPTIFRQFTAKEKKEATATMCAQSLLEEDLLNLNPELDLTTQLAHLRAGLSRVQETATNKNAPQRFQNLAPPKGSLTRSRIYSRTQHRAQTATNRSRAEITALIREALAQDQPDKAAIATLHESLEAETLRYKERRKRAETAHKRKRAAHIQSLAYTARKALHKLIFDTPSSANTASRPGTEIRDPATGTITRDPEEIKRILFNHHSAQAHTTEYRDRPLPETLPWANPQGPDPFTIIPKGDQKDNLELLTFEVFSDQIIDKFPTGRAVGDDGLVYETIKALAPAARRTLYEFVIRIHTEIEVPDPLKRSRIWLLLKAEPNTDPINHRPISLFSVVTKMLTACTAYLLTAYVETHNIISPEQRGFQSAKGTADHLFMVPAILEDANINRRDLRLLYVDWKQAFPSIPHDRLFQTLELLGIPSRLISMVKQLYTGQRASVLTPHGETEQFEVTLGGLQGEKLTPTLWLLFMQPLLRWLGEGNRGYCFTETIEGRRVRITLPTFADDLGVATGSNADMQVQINKIHAFNRDWAGSLDLGLSKCALTGLCWPNSDSSSPGNANALRCALHDISYRGYNDKTGPSFKILPSDQPYRYLGLQLCADLTWKQQFTIMNKKIRQHCDALKSSRGIDGKQKLIVLESKLIPEVTYTALAGAYSPAQMDAFDRRIHAVAKAALSQPPSTPQLIISSPKELFGAGIPSLASHVHIHSLKRFLDRLRDPGIVGDATRCMLKSYYLRAGKHPVTNLPNLIADPRCTLPFASALMSWNTHDPRDAPIILAEGNLLNMPDAAKQGAHVAYIAAAYSCLDIRARPNNLRAVLQLATLGVEDIRQLLCQVKPENTHRTPNEAVTKRRRPTDVTKLPDIYDTNFEKLPRGKKPGTKPTARVTPAGRNTENTQRTLGDRTDVQDESMHVADLPEFYDSILKKFPDTDISLIDIPVYAGPNGGAAQQHAARAVRPLRDILKELAPKANTSDATTRAPEAHSWAGTAIAALTNYWQTPAPAKPGTPFPRAQCPKTKEVSCRLITSTLSAIIGGGVLPLDQQQARIHAIPGTSVIGNIGHRPDIPPEHNVGHKDFCGSVIYTLAGGENWITQLNYRFCADQGIPAFPTRRALCRRMRPSREVPIRQEREDATKEWPVRLLGMRINQYAPEYSQPQSTSDDPSLTAAPKASVLPSHAQLLTRFGPCVCTKEEILRDIDEGYEIDTAACWNGTQNTNAQTHTPGPWPVSAGYKGPDTTDHPPLPDPNPEPTTTTWETTDDEDTTQKWLVYYRPMWENPSEINITPDQAQEFLTKYKVTLDAAARADDPITKRARRTQVGRPHAEPPKETPAPSPTPNILAHVLDVCPDLDIQPTGHHHAQPPPSDLNPATDNHYTPDAWLGIHLPDGRCRVVLPRPTVEGLIAHHERMQNYPALRRPTTSTGAHSRDPELIPRHGNLDPALKSICSLLDAGKLARWGPTTDRKIRNDWLMQNAPQPFPYLYEDAADLESPLILVFNPLDPRALALPAISADAAHREFVPIIKPGTLLWDDTYYLTLSLDEGIAKQQLAKAIADAQLAQTNNTRALGILTAALPSLKQALELLARPEVFVAGIRYPTAAEKAASKTFCEKPSPLLSIPVSTLPHVLFIIANAKALEDSTLRGELTSISAFRQAMEDHSPPDASARKLYGTAITAIEAARSRHLAQDAPPRADRPPPSTHAPLHSHKNKPTITALRAKWAELNIPCQEALLEDAARHLSPPESPHPGLNFDHSDQTIPNLYTDGSALKITPEDAAPYQSAGAGVFLAGATPQAWAFTFRADQQSYNAEGVAALEAVRFAVTELPATITTVNIFVDCSGVLYDIRKYAAKPHTFPNHERLWVLRPIIELAQSRPGLAIHLWKCKGHCGIKGNDAADSIARAAAGEDDQDPTRPAVTPTLSTATNANVGRAGIALTLSQQLPVQPPPALTPQTFQPEPRSEARNFLLKELKGNDRKILLKLRLARQTRAVEQTPNNRLLRTMHGGGEAHPELTLDHIIHKDVKPPPWALISEPTNAIWQLPPSQLRVVLSARWRTLVTRSQLHKWYPAEFPDDLCPYCKPMHELRPDTVGHWLSGVCGCPGAAQHGRTRHERGCTIIADFTRALLPLETSWEHYADTKAYQTKKGCSSRTMPSCITDRLPKHLAKLSPDHVIIHWKNKTARKAHAAYICDTKFSMEDKLQQSDADNQNHYAELVIELEKLLGCKVELLTLPTGSTGGMPHHTRSALLQIAKFLTQNRPAGSPDLGLFNRVKKAEQALVKAACDAAAIMITTRRERDKANPEMHTPGATPPPPPPRPDSPTQRTDEEDSSDEEGPQPAADEPPAQSTPPGAAKTQNTRSTPDATTNIQSCSAELPESYDSMLEELLGIEKTPTDIQADADDRSPIIPPSSPKGRLVAGARRKQPEPTSTHCPIAPPKRSRPPPAPPLPTSGEHQQQAPVDPAPAEPELNTGAAPTLNPRPCPQSASHPTVAQGRAGGEGLQVVGKRGRDPPTKSQDDDQPEENGVLLTTKARRLNHVHQKNKKKRKKLKKIKPKGETSDHHPLPLPHAAEGKRERDVDISRQLPRAKRRRRPHIEGYLGIAASS